MKKIRFTIFLAIMFMIVGLFHSVSFATTETGTRGASTFPVYGVGHAGSLKTAYGTYDITVAPADGNIYELCRIPANATIVGGRFYAFDLDAGTESLDIDIGWAANGSDAADPDGLLNAGVLTGDAVTDVKPETGTSMPFGGVLITSGKKTFVRETVIQAECNAAANSFSAGTIGVVVHYMMP